MNTIRILIVLFFVLSQSVFAKGKGHAHDVAPRAVVDALIAHTHPNFTAKLGLSTAPFNDFAYIIVPVFEFGVLLSPSTLDGLGFMGEFSKWIIVKVKSFQMPSTLLTIYGHFEKGGDFLTFTHKTFFFFDAGISLPLATFSNSLGLNGGAGIGKRFYTTSYLTHELTGKVNVDVILTNPVLGVIPAFELKYGVLF